MPFTPLLLLPPTSPTLQPCLPARFPFKPASNSSAPQSLHSLDSQSNADENAAPSSDPPNLHQTTSDDALALHPTPANAVAPHPKSGIDVSRSQQLQSIWVPVCAHQAAFDSNVFTQVALNLVQNPSVASSHLFRADSLYDSQQPSPPDPSSESDLDDESSPHSLNRHVGNLDLDGRPRLSQQELDRLRAVHVFDRRAFPGYELQRVLIRTLVPRNPQLDRPIAQTCWVLQSTPDSRAAVRMQHTPETTLPEGVIRTVLVLMPHADTVEQVPWYHPAVQSLAYVHDWNPSIADRDSRDDVTQDVEAAAKLGNGSQLDSPGQAAVKGWLSIHMGLFPGQSCPISERLQRTATKLLQTLHRHGNGILNGYKKRVHHDQLVSQARVQDRYTALKMRHAKRLCANWVEQTDPVKHVFEDLGIAAFVLELWRDLYQTPASARSFVAMPLHKYHEASKPAFPGFVDMGCGNGVLTEVLRLEGYSGWGFDARRRKTWARLQPDTRAYLFELVLVPQFLHEISQQPLALSPAAQERLHNGQFAPGTFLISNHADELTGWTPLLAAQSQSPFLAIPCCSHNLSGQRFRAPSAANSQTADVFAPSYFKHVKPIAPATGVEAPKSIPIVAMSCALDSDVSSEGEASSRICQTVGTTTAQSSDQTLVASQNTPLLSSQRTPHKAKSQRSGKGDVTRHAAETGDLKMLGPAARSKQPSAYASLCAWVTHLACEVGYEVEREMLRIPSTRNVGLVGRLPALPSAALTSKASKASKAGKRNSLLAAVPDDARSETRALEHRAAVMQQRARLLVLRERVDGAAWVRRCVEVLAKQDTRSH